MPPRDPDTICPSATFPVLHRTPGSSAHISGQLDDNIKIQKFRVAYYSDGQIVSGASMPRKVDVNLYPRRHVVPMWRIAFLGVVT